MTELLARLGMATHLASYAVAASAMPIGAVWPIEVSIYMWITSVLMIVALVLFGD